MRIFEQKKLRLIKHPKVKIVGKANFKIYRHPKLKDDYYLYKTVGRDEIYRPILTPDEYARRKKKLYDSAVRFLIHVENEERKRAEVTDGLDRRDKHAGRA